MAGPGKGAGRGLVDVSLGLPKTWLAATAAHRAVSRAALCNKAFFGVCYKNQAAAYESPCFLSALLRRLPQRAVSRGSIDARHPYRLGRVSARATQRRQHRYRCGRTATPCISPPCPPRPGSRPGICDVHRDSHGLGQGARVLKCLRPDCDTATLRAVRRLPRVGPCTQFGKPLACGYTVPVKFSLPAKTQPPK